MRTFFYVVQENLANEGWVDHHVFRAGGGKALPACRDMLMERLTNPIWHGNSNERKWRMVRRCVTDTEIQ